VLDSVLDWLQSNADALGWFALIAALSWVFTLAMVPVLIARIPVDYFSRGHRRPLYADSRHPVIGWTLATLKNLLGVLLIAAGILMLLTPGQGTLTILIGLLLVNFPGKYSLECWVVRRRGVLRTLNWLRSKVGRPPIDPP
jgi:hypothetical protein